MYAEEVIQCIHMCACEILFAFSVFNHVFPGQIVSLISVKVAQEAWCSSLGQRMLLYAG